MCEFFFDGYGWKVAYTGHNIILTKEYKEATMAGKNGKSKGSVDSVREVGGGYAGLNKSFKPMDAADPEMGGMKGAHQGSGDYSQNVKPMGRRDNASRTIRGKNPSTGK